MKNSDCLLFTVGIIWFVNEGDGKRLMAGTITTGDNYGNMPGSLYAWIPGELHGTHETDEADINY